MHLSVKLNSTSLTIVDGLGDVNSIAAPVSVSRGKRRSRAEEGAV